MAGREIRLSRVPPGTSPNILSLVTTAAQTFQKGAIVVLASNKISEAGSTPTTGIVGVTLEAAFTEPGNSLANTSQLATGSPIGGRPNDVKVAINDRTQVFSGRMVNGGTDPVTPAQTDVGAKYGLAKDSNGIWYVNQADTTNLAVIVIDIEQQTYNAAPAVVYFKFINASPLSN